MNRIVIIGRLTADPEARQAGGVNFSKFSVAVDRGFGDNKQTDFFDVIAWRKLGEVVANNLSKGRQVAISGSMHSNLWRDNEGNNRKSWEVVANEVIFLDAPSGGNKSQETFNDYDDEFPF